MKCENASTYSMTKERAIVASALPIAAMTDFC